jgi:hypothetical protein
MKNNSNTVEFYSKAMSSMPFIFSSHKFLGKLRKTGIRKEEIKSDFHLSFLLNNSERINKFLWRKKEVQIEIPLKAEPIAQPIMNDEEMLKYLTDKKYIKPAKTDEEMIQHLKEKGYKVLKQTWDEL